MEGVSSSATPPAPSSWMCSPRSCANLVDVVGDKNLSRRIYGWTVIFNSSVVVLLLVSRGGQRPQIPRDTGETPWCPSISRPGPFIIQHSICSVATTHTQEHRPGVMNLTWRVHQGEGRTNYKGGGQGDQEAHQVHQNVNGSQFW